MNSEVAGWPSGWPHPEGACMSMGMGGGKETGFFRQVAGGVADGLAFVGEATLDGDHEAAVVAGAKVVFFL